MVRRKLMLRQHDLLKLQELVALREKENISQQEAAAFFGLSDYESVAAWERGESRPQRSRRERFMIYLLDKVGLRRTPERFCNLWHDVMVVIWGWNQLNSEELKELFPGSKVSIPDLPYSPTPDPIVLTQDVYCESMLPI